MMAGVDRRRFLQAVGAVAGLGALGTWASASPGRFAYVASGEDCLHVFAGHGGEWSVAQTVSSVAPVGVATSRDGRFVYVGNAVDRFEERPTGSVEAFAADKSGRLTLVGRQGLALFAVAPERLAVSPNGRWLAVGLAAGGYNLLPLGADGLPGRVTASLKRIGEKSAAGALEFLDDRSLLSFDGEAVTKLSVGQDGSLAFAALVTGERPSAWVPRGSEVDAGLMRAIALAGIQPRPALAISQVAL